MTGSDNDSFLSTPFTPISVRQNSNAGKWNAKLIQWIPISGTLWSIFHLDFNTKYDMMRGGEQKGRRHNFGTAKIKMGNYV